LARPLLLNGRRLGNPQSFAFRSRDRVHRHDIGAGGEVRAAPRPRAGLQLVEECDRAPLDADHTDESARGVVVCCRRLPRQLGLQRLQLAAAAAQGGTFRAAAVCSLE
jgi:hypothetical protein